MSKMLNFVKSLLFAAVPESKLTDEAVDAAKIAYGVKKAQPSAAWAQALMADPVKALAEAGISAGDALDDAAAVKVVAKGGDLGSGSGALVMVKLWAAPNGGFKKGTPIWASTEEGKTFAWLAMRAGNEGGADTGACLIELDPATGEAVSAPQFNPVDDNGQPIPLKFKPDARSMRQDYFLAVAGLEAWLAAGDGTRRELVAVMRLVGDCYDETNKAGVPSGNRLQTVSAMLVLEVPRVDFRGGGSVSALGLSATPVKRKRIEAAAAPIADAADAAVPLSAFLADADEI